MKEKRGDTIVYLLRNIENNILLPFNKIFLAKGESASENGVQYHPTGPIVKGKREDFIIRW